MELLVQQYTRCYLYRPISTWSAGAPNSRDEPGNYLCGSRFTFPQSVCFGFPHSGEFLWFRFPGTIYFVYVPKRLIPPLPPPTSPTSGSPSVCTVHCHNYRNVLWYLLVNVVSSPFTSVQVIAINRATVGRVSPSRLTEIMVPHNWIDP